PVPDARGEGPEYEETRRLLPCHARQDRPAGSVCGPRRYAAGSIRGEVPPLPPRLAGPAHSTVRAVMLFSRLNLTGARTILTGASSGIGHALALRLAEQGAKLVLASRNQERLTLLADSIHGRGGSAVVVPTDVVDPAQRTRLVEEARSALGGIDILINN